MLLILALTFPGLAFAQEGPSAEALVTALQDRDQTALNLNTADASITPEEAWSYHGENEIWIRNVTQPTLLPVLPAPEKATGAGVLVVPGGGFQFISMANEGYPVADWLAEQGIAAFVLKYRTLTVPADRAEFDAHMMQLWAPQPGDAPIDYASGVHDASEDALAALRLIDANAADWGVDPDRLGILGFSAGAMTSMEVLITAPAGQAPDFMGYIYGPMTAVDVPDPAPPLFVALAADDPLLRQQGFGLIEAWSNARAPVELHYYSAGGHGFAAHKRGATSDMWFGQFLDWLETQGLLAPLLPID